MALLTGCAADQGAHPGAGHSASATAAASPPAAPAVASSPTTVAIGRYTEQFADSLPTNPAQASVIEGFREAEILWNKSEQSWQLVAPVTQYVTAGALSHLKEAIANEKQHGIVLAGTDVFFMTRVTSLTATSATVTTCDNGSKLTRDQPARLAG